MWAIIKLVNNNFNDFFIKDKFKKIFTVKSESQKIPILTLIDYHIRVAHDLKTMKNNKK